MTTDAKTKMLPTTAAEAKSAVLTAGGWLRVIIESPDGHRRRGHDVEGSLTVPKKKTTKTVKPRKSATLDEYDKAQEAIEARILPEVYKAREAAGVPPEAMAVLVRYSVGKLVKGLPVDNLDVVPVEGPIRFRADTNPFWVNLGQRKPGAKAPWPWLNQAPDTLKGAKFKGYESAVVKSPTWLQIAVLADDMIRTTGDFHHVFLEGVTKRPGPVPADGIPRYSFSMGS